MALCGLAPVASGEVRLDGKALGRDGDGRLTVDRRRVALMFQDAAGSLSPRMTVRALLAEPFVIHPGHRWNCFYPNEGESDPVESS